MFVAVSENVRCNLAMARAAMPNLAEGTRLEVVACDAEAATALITRPDGMRTVLKAARRSEEKLEALRVQWNVLSLLSDETGFPGPRPLERYRLSNGIEAIELTYLPGTHPRFGDQQEFRAFGATIAHLHRASRHLDRAAAINKRTCLLINAGYGQPGFLGDFASQALGHRLESVPFSSWQFKFPRVLRVVLGLPAFLQ